MAKNTLLVTIFKTAQSTDTKVSFNVSQMSRGGRTYEAKKAMKITLGLDRIDSHNDLFPARTLCAGSKGTLVVAASASEGILDMNADSRPNGKGA